MTRLRLVFMGTPEFSVPVLEHLIAARHEILCVYSQPPRPAGRGQKPQLTPVHACADHHGIKVRTPGSFKTEDVQAGFAALNADAAVVVAYGLILPELTLWAPRLGCINIHASLLPRWRGAAPIQRAIQAGDQTSGITIMQMDAGLDTGPMLANASLPLGPQMTASCLHDKLSVMGAEMINPTLQKLNDKTAIAIAQPTSGVTYAAKLDKAEGRVDWSRSAVEIDRLVRALTPWPGVWFEFKGERIKIFETTLIRDNSTQAPGTVIDDQLTVACGDGAIRINALQRPGKKRARAEEVLRGFKIQPATQLQS